MQRLPLGLYSVPVDFLPKRCKKLIFEIRENPPEFNSGLPTLVFWNPMENGKPRGCATIYYERSFIRMWKRYAKKGSHRRRWLITAIKKLAKNPKRYKAL